MRSKLKGQAEEHRREWESAHELKLNEQLFAEYRNLLKMGQDYADELQQETDKLVEEVKAEQAESARVAAENLELRTELQKLREENERLKVGR